jgi:type I restriction enzyme S subunit
MKAMGIGQPNVNATSLSKISLALAPQNEQHRIVDKIEELFSELDNGIANLNLAQSQLKVYRQAFLKAAFEGKLTEEWRKQNNPEPAEELLERIKEERQARFDREIEEWEAAFKEWKKGGNEGKKPRKPTSLVKMEKLSFDNLSSYNIPSTWTWCRNNELIYYVTSGSRDWKKFYSDQGAYFIRTQDIKSNELKLKEAAYVDLPDNVEGKRSLVEKGDLLMTITGANVGKIAYIKDEINEAYVSQSVALMKPVDIKLSPYLHFYFQSVAYGAGLIDKLVYGVGRPVLSLENMREVPVTLPSIEEQVEIINELESGFSILDNLEEAIATSLKQGGILKQSILKKAFEGKLVTQDPNDESASILLERIKGEKAKYLAEQKKRKKKSPKKIRKMSKDLTIEDVLKAAKEPMQAKEVWQQSKHKDDIEAFYAELKKIQDRVKEVKKGTESLISLVK